MSQFNANRDRMNAQMQMDMLGLNDRSQLSALQLGMGGAGPGLGTQIMAGGATAMPGLMQQQQAKQQQEMAMQQQEAAFNQQGAGGRAWDHNGDFGPRPGFGQQYAYSQPAQPSRQTMEWQQQLMNMYGTPRG